MPIYEFHCATCHRIVSELCSSSEPLPTRASDCAGQCQLTKQWSRVAGITRDAAGQAAARAVQDALHAKGPDSPKAHTCSSSCSHSAK